MACVPNKSEPAAGFLGHRGPQSLEAVIKDECLLFLNEDYAVINKPADVRMDGQFNVTVERLLLSWGVGEVGGLKWVHQLDYATSGCLCVGLNRRAAAAVSLSFELRAVKKSYLALVEGHVFPEAWPLSEHDDDHSTASDDVVGVPRKVSSKRKEGRGCLQNLVQEQSVAALLTTLASELKKAEEDSTVACSGGERFDSMTRLQTLRDLYRLPAERFKRDRRLRKALRKALRVHVEGVDIANGEFEICPVASGTDLRSNLAVELREPVRSGEIDQTITVSARSLADINPTATIPSSCSSRTSICRLSPSSLSGVLSRDHAQAHTSPMMRVSLPVAEITGDFRCEIGHPGNPGRQALTLVTVLQRGYFRGRPVTKLLLQPHTGRRHQLRLHCLAMGFPIVGDFTYGGVASESAERMMLHSYSLIIPEVPRRGTVTMPANILIDVATPDPFGFLAQLPQESPT